MSSLLIQEPPLQVLPSLANEIGLNEAIMLQQVHYWGLKKEDGWTYQSVKDWAEQFPFWSERTIERTISSLKKTGLLQIEQRGGQMRTNHYRVNYDSIPPFCRFEPATLADSPYKAETTQRNTSKKKGTDPRVEEVFSYWQKVMKKDRARLTPERKSKVLTRLSNYSVADIRRGIDGCAGSDFNMGREPGQPKQWNDLTLICRNDTKLEEFMAMPRAESEGDDFFAGVN